MGNGDARSQPPPRPSDPLFSVIWDLTYGPASPTNPLNKLGQQIDGLKDSLRTVGQAAQSLDEINRSVRDTNTVLREANVNMKEASAILKGLSDKL